MTEIDFKKGELTEGEQLVINAGFERHSEQRSAPCFQKERLNWLARGADGAIVGALTADLLWDWLYIDELWVDESCRGQGLGKDLMQVVEEYARAQSLVGIWLWTQSWQAAEFYQKLGYQEFTRFNDFPKGHCRLGFRKTLEDASA